MNEQIYAEGIAVFNELVEILILFRTRKIFLMSRTKKLNKDLNLRRKFIGWQSRIDNISFEMTQVQASCVVQGDKIFYFLYQWLVFEAEMEDNAREGADLCWKPIA